MSINTVHEDKYQKNVHNLSSTPRTLMKKRIQPCKVWLQGASLIISVFMITKTLDELKLLKYMHEEIKLIRITKG